MNKNEARKQALASRSNNVLASKAVVDYIINNHLLDDYQNIGIYYPIGKEISVIDLKKYYSEKKFYLPVTREEIYFALYEDNLVDGKFKTKEPIGSEVNRDLLDCIVVPCVAIGKDNRRIGYGKGYYDRYLEGYNGLKIGVVYQNAIFDCDCDSFDVKLDIIVKG